MPEFAQPTSDSARAEFLRTATGAAQSDYRKGDKFILDETFQKLQSFSPTFSDKVDVINQTESERSSEFEESNNALSVLEMYIRDAYEVARRQVRRLEYPSQVLVLYGLPHDGITPNPTVASEWIRFGWTYVKGAEKVASEGYQVVTCPSTEEIRVVLEKAEKEFGEVAPADSKLRKASSAIAELRAQADELIGDVMSELRLTLRKMDSSTQRRIQRTYGARFRYLPGEPVDDGDDEPLTPNTNQPISAS